MSVARPLPLATARAAQSLRPLDPFGGRMLDGATVVFDLDGTLVDTAPDLTGALNHCLESAGLPRTSVEIVRPIAGRGARAMLTAAYDAAGRALDEAELRRQTDCFLRFYAMNIAIQSVVFPGAVEALERMAQAGATLAVCTNKTEALARKLLAELGLAERFAAICGADTFPARKPDPIHLSGTIAAAGGNPARALMVGDTDTDIESARRMGLPSILLGFGYDADAAARAKASAVVSHFDEVGVALVARLLPKPKLDAGPILPD